jgi:hypothetical protein
VPTSTTSNTPVVLTTMLSLSMNPKLETVGLFNVTLLVPSYIFSFAVIPEIVIAFAEIAADGFVL